MRALLFQHIRLTFVNFLSNRRQPLMASIFSHAIAATALGTARYPKKDVLKYLETRGTASPAPASAPAAAAPSIPASVGSDGIEIIAMDHIRKKIAEHMVHTVHTSPHVGLYIDVDMSNITTIRERNKMRF